MSEFKIGNTVRVVANSNNSCNQRGDVGIITEINADRARVSVHIRGNRGNWHPFSDLALIEELSFNYEIF